MPGNPTSAFFNNQSARRPPDGLSQRGAKLLADRIRRELHNVATVIARDGDSGDWVIIVKTAAVPVDQEGHP